MRVGRPRWSSDVAPNGAATCGENRKSGLRSLLLVVETNPNSQQARNWRTTWYDQVTCGELSPLGSGGVRHVRIPGHAGV